VSASFRALARRAAARYPPRDRYARHFAYGKLTRDPVFEHLLECGWIPPDSRILDVGCGQGLVAALLAAEGRHGRWRYRGIDASARDIERARYAAGPAGDLVMGGCTGRNAHFSSSCMEYLLQREAARTVLPARKYSRAAERCSRRRRPEVSKHRLSTGHRDDGTRVG